MTRSVPPSLLLAIESSCDESAVALVRDGVHVVAERIATQTAIHAAAGGVVPEGAARAHLEQLPSLLDEVLGEAHRAGIDEEIGAVAVTTGPGLVGSLLIGTGVATAWAWGRGLPVLPTNHLEGHFRAAWLSTDGAPTSAQLPAVVLIVSGGHTLLAHVDEAGRAQRLGTTIDDAAGEAFDKIARLIGLPYPGGAALSALAATAGRNVSLALPIARTDSPYDFSFSGVKTAAVRLALEAIGADPASPGRAAALSRLLNERPLASVARVNIAAAAEAAIVGALVERVDRALAAHPGATLVVGGGVAANEPLRAALAAVALAHGRALAIPPRAWCTDNAAMIGAAAYAAFRDGRALLTNAAVGLRVDPSWAFGSPPTA